MMPSVFTWSFASFPLDRDRDLEIDIWIKFVMRVEGTGAILYSAYLDSEPFLIHVPQWDIHTYLPPE
jgi:hypothetical protein